MKKVFSFAFALMLGLSASAQDNSFRNPIIPGYHPDPSICRVGSDYYLVNSTFEYFPGVPVSKSNDLIHWQQVGNVLDRDSQLNLKGATSWTGIYAPTIRYNNGTWYMITTNVGNGGNFMVTAKSPEGPWSEPIWLQQQGIDPSLYFEGDKCFMCSNPDDAIFLCEIDPVTGKQLTPSKKIWEGTGGRYVEGPHIYKKDGYYYLLCSEGGTEMAHSLTIARSKNIYGPYVSNPANPILTNCNQKGQTKNIQGTGHGDFIQAEDGSWWITFLAYRNFGGAYHHLGRETYLAPVEWKKGQWPVVNGGNAIDTLMTAKLLKGASAPIAKKHIGPKIDLSNPQWLYIQNPICENYVNKDGKLCLKANGSLTGNNQPTFVGLRQEHANMSVETSIDVENINGLGEYGLSVYQINDGHFDLATNGRRVWLLCHLKSLDVICGEVDCYGSKNIKLKIESDGNDYRFLCAGDDGEWKEVGKQSCTLMSTEVAGGFTGVVIGMFASDDSKGSTAVFNEFIYQEK